MTLKSFITEGRCVAPPPFSQLQGPSGRRQPSSCSGCSKQGENMNKLFSLSACFQKLRFPLQIFLLLSLICTLILVIIWAFTLPSLLLNFWLACKKIGFAVTFSHTDTILLCSYVPFLALFLVFFLLQIVPLCFHRSLYFPLLLMVGGFSVSCPVQQPLTK